MSTETYLNSTPKGCQTCRFKVNAWGENRPLFWHCGKTGGYCTTMRGLSAQPGAECDNDFSGWAPIPPKPPRRSLRQWIYDLLWA